MIRGIFFLLFTVLFSLPGLADRWACGPDAKSSAFAPLEDFSKNNCEKQKMSTECQQVYKEIQDKGDDPLNYALKCDGKDAYGQKTYNVLVGGGEFLYGCAIGASNYVEKIGTSMGESAAQYVLSQGEKQQELKSCSGDIEKKKFRYADYNERVPTLLRVKIPDIATLEKQDCAKIDADLEVQRRQQSQRAFKRVRDRLNDPNAKYSAEEKQYVDWNNKINQPEQRENIIGLAEKRLQEYKINFRCYNNARRWALICEASAEILSIGRGPSLAAVKAVQAARIAKIAGLEAKAVAMAAGASKAVVIPGTADLTKVDDFVESARSAQRATAGAGGRITDKAAQQSLLAASGSMNAEERILAFEKLTNRTAPLSEGEARQLLKMHDVGSSEGRTFSTLTKADKDKKIELAQEINPETGKPYFSQSDVQVAMRNGITGNSDLRPDQVIRQAQEHERMAKTYPSPQSERVYAQSAKALPDKSPAQLKAIYDNAYEKTIEQYEVQAPPVQKGGISSINEANLIALKEGPLQELEDMAALAGNTKQLDAIRKAKEAAIQKRISETPPQTYRARAK